jgi:meso-butanediol dehydrogenase/(S,S)-butanediol dehydrogenase/diacetyl reductase
MNRFLGKVAVVTGAARGLGEAIAARFLAEGAYTVALDLHLAPQKHPERHSAHILDIRDLDAVRATVDHIQQKFGRIDIWVNNAGIYQTSTIQEMTAKEWQLSLDVNLTGAVYCIQAVAPIMMGQSYGRIVNMSSMAGMVGFPATIAYGTTKTALIGLTRAAAVDLGPHGITVNAICPGSIMTDMQIMVDAKICEREGWPPGTFNAKRAAEVPMRRLGTPEDVAGLVTFLASDDASYITGQSIIVDGGLMPI